MTEHRRKFIGILCSERHCISQWELEFGSYIHSPDKTGTGKVDLPILRARGQVAQHWGMGMHLTHVIFLSISDNNRCRFGSCGKPGLSFSLQRVFKKGNW